MKRDLATLEATEFDLVVVGGGVFGACAALDAAQRGLRVALIEAADFCQASSAQSFKLIHGGMRYLQHLDFWRVRHSSEARRQFLRLAPHLVHPLPIVVPTYGWALKSRWALRVAMATYDVVTAGRNRGVHDPARHVPPGRCLSRGELLSRYPGVKTERLTGAGIFCDGQMYNPPRLVLAFVRTAVRLGAVAANYVRATRLEIRENRATGVGAVDVLSGRKFTIRARSVLNAAGPYAEQLMSSGLGRPLSRPLYWSRDSFFVVGRRLIEGGAALALQSRTRDPDARLSRGARHLFLVPWRQYTLVGVWHKVHVGDPDDFRVTEHELQTNLDEINDNYAGLHLTLSDISFSNAGLIPFGNNEQNAKDLRFAHRSRIVDHNQEHGIKGLATLIGARFTTGPCEAVEAIDLLARNLGGSIRPSMLGDTPLDGGDFTSFQGVVENVLSAAAGRLNRPTAEALAHNYGTSHGQVLALAHHAPDLLATIGTSSVLRAEVIHAVREEMAQNLSDVVLRRTDLGTGEHLDRETLVACAQLLGAELGWNTARIEREVESLFDRRPQGTSSSGPRVPQETVAQPPA